MRVLKYYQTIFLILALSFTAGCSDGFIVNKISMEDNSSQQIIVEQEVPFNPELILPPSTSPAPLPSGDGEVHLKQAEWVFEDDFEGVKDTSFWERPRGEVEYGAECSSDPSANGKALVYTYQPNWPSAGSGDAENRFKIPIKARQVEISYDVFIPSNYIHSSGNHKIITLWSGAYGTGEANFWFSSEAWDAGSGAKPSLYIGEDGNKYGQTVHYKNPPKVFNDHQGSWQRMHFFVELAENESDLGYVQIRKNGELLIGTNQPNLGPSYDGAPPVREHVRYASRGNYVNRGYLFGWANGGFQETTVFCIDNFSIKANSTIKN